MRIRTAIAPVFVAALLSVGCSRRSVAVQTPTAPLPPEQPAAVQTPKPQAAKPTQTATATPRTEPSRGITPQERAAVTQSLARVEDALFDYDKATIRPDAATKLRGDVEVIRAALTKYPSENIKLEGHADERGSAEYNLGLGDRRALAVKEFLTTMGVPAGQLSTVSFGKEKPQCTDATEACWQQNRRVHLELASN